MVSSQTFSIFVVACVALVMVPGPNHLYITARSIAEGRRSGVASALGVECGTLVHIAVAAAGLSYLVAKSALAFSLVKYAGAGYLGYLGIRTLLSRGAGPDIGVTRPAQSLRRAYLEGIVVNVLNPKVILFFLAFLPQFVDRDAGSVPAQIALLGAVLAGIGLASDLLYAVAAGSVGDVLRERPRFQRYQRYLSGVIYLGLGAATAVAGPGHRR